MRNTWVLLASMIISLFLFPDISVIIKDASGVGGLPTVTVSAFDPEMEPGKTTTVTVSMYTLSGDEPVPLELRPVRISATHGTLSPSSTYTDPTGSCTFSYRSPSTIEAPTHVTITATSDNGPLSFTGSVSILVSHRLHGELLGPSVLTKGGPEATYILKVTAGASALQGVSVMPTIMGAGTRVSHSSSTNITGESTIVLKPSVSKGTVSVLVQLSKSDYLSTAISKAITVEDALSDIALDLSASKTSIKSWGSTTVTAIATVRDDPIGGAQIAWSISSGWLSQSITLTDNDGRSIVSVTALADADGPFPATIMVTASMSYQGTTRTTSQNISVIAIDVLCTPEIDIRSSGGQLFPEESLRVGARIHLNPGMSWEYITPVNVDAVLYNDQGFAVNWARLGTGMTIDAGFDWESPLFTLHNVPMDASDQTYTWDVLIRSINGAHIYSRLPEPIPVKILAEGKDDWTFLLYINGNNNLYLEGPGCINNLEPQAPQGEFAFLVQIGLAWLSNTKRYELGRYPVNGIIDSTVLSQMDRLDFGDPDTLRDFILWGSERNPAGHYCIIVWDHGGGYMGSSDDYYGKSRIDNIEMMEVLKDFSYLRRKTDILAFDACLMSSLDAAYHFKDVANYLVGSGETVIGDFTVPETLSRILQFYPDQRPQPIHVATDMLMGYIDRKGDDAYPYSVLDLGASDLFYRKLDALCQLIMDHWAEVGRYLHVLDRFTEYRPELSYTSARDLIWAITNELIDKEGEHHLAEAAALSEEVKAAYDVMLLSTIARGDDWPVNLALPGRYAKWGDHYHDFLTGGLGAMASWLALWDWYYLGPHGSAIGHITKPVMSKLELPILSSNAMPISIGPDGRSRGIDVDLVLDRMNITEDLTVMVDLLAFKGYRQVGIDGLVDREVKVIPVGGSGRVAFDLTSPVMDGCEVRVIVMDKDGNVIQTIDLGTYSMNSTPLDDAAPVASIVASNMAPLEGEDVTFSVDATDNDGDTMTFWWDLDDRDGVGIDSTEVAVEHRYLGPGSVQAACIVSDGDHFTVLTLNLSVRPDLNNTIPIPSLSWWRGAGTNEILFDACGSEDSDGDNIEYRFRFGDGPWMEWMDDGSISYTFPSAGAYVSGLIVRDARGGTSDPLIVVVNTWNWTPLDISIDISDIERKDGNRSVSIDLNGSYDPIKGMAVFMLDWGDGNRTIGTAHQVAFVHDYARYGEYDLKVTAIDGNGYTVDKGIKVRVRERAPEIDEPYHMFWYLVAGLLVVLLLLFLLAGAIVLIAVRRTHIEE